MNNLIILFDSLSAASLGCYGSNSKTPAFDKVAANGDVFTHCYSDLSGKLVDEFVEQFSPQVINDSDADVTTLNRSESDTSETQVVRVVSKFENQYSDKLLKSLINYFTYGKEHDFNLVITALRGTVTKENSTKNSHFPDEIAVHVPFVVSLAHQTVSRRRLDLLTSEVIVQLIESLTTSVETYERFRDSIALNQISYSTADVVATRTHDWLHFRENHLDEYGEHSQQLYRKPEDVWEILNVADQYPQLIEHFEATGQLTFPK